MRAAAPVLGIALAVVVGSVACHKQHGTDDTDTDTDVVADTDTDVSQVDDTDTDLPDTDVPDTDVPCIPPVAGVTYGCEVGTGETDFTPLCPGDSVVVHHGQQGRWHVFGAVRCHGIVGGGASGSSSSVDLQNTDNPTLQWKLVDADGVLHAGYDALRRPMTMADGQGLTGEYLVFWTGAYEEAAGQDMTMVFHLTDVAGAVVDVSIPLHLLSDLPADTDPPADTDVP